MERITAYDFPDTISVVDGYDSEEVIDLTRRNFDFMVDVINDLIGIVNELKGE